MRNVVKYAVGLSIVAALLVLAKPANAQDVRWANFDRTHGGPFFMGVAGGCVGNPCRLFSGTKIIVWANVPNDGKNHDDQLWETTIPGPALFSNILPSWTPQLAVLSVQGGSTANGAQIVVRDAVPSVPSPDQNWEVRRAEDFQAPFTGCFIFRNVNSGQVAGVQAGNVQDGVSVIQWPFYLGTPNSFAGWHPDQFWCPVTP